MLWPSHRPVQRRPQALKVTCVVVVIQMDAKRERVGQRKDASSLPGKKRAVMCLTLGLGNDVDSCTTFPTHSATSLFPVSNLREVFVAVHARFD